MLKFLIQFLKRSSLLNAENVQILVQTFDVLAARLTTNKVCFELHQAAAFIMCFVHSFFAFCKIEAFDYW